MYFIEINKVHKIKKVLGTLNGESELS